MRKVTIITGASSGMGAEFARQIYKNTESTEIWLIARNKEKLEAVKNEITDSEKSTIKIKCVSLDLAGKEGVRLFKTYLSTERISGSYEIDMLINNAGFGTYGEFMETPLERELEMIDLNCTALTGICGSVIPFMHENSFIINVASLAAFLPLGNFAVYAATKSYVLSFSVALAAELKSKGIKVSALCPGSVSTDFANVASNGVRKEVLNGKDPVKVVSHCLKKAKKGKLIILWAFKWKLTAFMSHFVSRKLGASYTYKYNKRPWQKTQD